MVTLSQFGNVPADLLPNANYTLSILNEIYSVFPKNYFRFTSGYRSLAKNAAVNGVPDSYHPKALAADIVPNNGKFPYSDAERIGQIVSKYGWQVIKHDAGSGLHYHIEPAPGWKGINSNNNQDNTLTFLAIGLLVFLLLD